MEKTLPQYYGLEKAVQSMDVTQETRGGFQAVTRHEGPCFPSRLLYRKGDKTVFNEIS